MSAFPKRFDGSKVGTVLGNKAKITRATADVPESAPSNEASSKQTSKEVVTSVEGAA